MAKPARNELRAMHAELGAALAEPVRIAILYELNNGPRNVSELVSSLQLNQTTVSRHLRFLHQRGMVDAERSGPNVSYSLQDPRVIQALDLMLAILTGILTRRQDLLQEMLAQQA